MSFLFWPHKCKVTTVVILRHTFVWFQFITVTYTYTDPEHSISRMYVKLSLIAILDSQNQAEYKGRVAKLCKVQFGQRKSPKYK